MVTLFILQVNSIAQDKKDKNDEWPKYKFGSAADSTYGKGGKINIDTAFFKDGSRQITIGYRDKDGKFRQSTQIYYNSEDGSETTTIQYFDETGKKKTKETAVTKDRVGNETSNREEFYIDGKIESGDIYYDEPGSREKKHKKYNKETQKYEPVEKTNGQDNNEDKKDKPFDFDVTGFLFLGGSLINENSPAGRFNTYGGLVVYNRPINKMGISAEAGINFGSDNNIDYTKVQVLAGISFFPKMNSDIFLSPHVLAGISHIKGEYGMNSSFSSSSFCMAAGADVGMPVSRRCILNLRADYNPTFPKGGVKNNFRVSGGVNIVL